MEKKQKKTSKAQTLEEITASLERTNALLEEILQTITEKTTPSVPITPPMDTEHQTISATLNWLGIPANLKGYTLCESALNWLINQEKNTISLTKELYPYLSNKFQTTPSRCERALRHAIHSGFERSPEIFLLLFPKITKCPTNSEFLFRLTNYLEKGC